jgi:hypothetical protein
MNKHVWHQKRKIEIGDVVRLKDVTYHPGSYVEDWCKSHPPVFTVRNLKTSGGRFIQLKEIWDKYGHHWYFLSSFELMEY